MSFILDALRRADAQRERDPARGIHAQAAMLPDDDEPRQPWRRALPALLALLLAAGGAAAWWSWRADDRLAPGLQTTSPSHLTAAATPQPAELPPPADAIHPAAAPLLPTTDAAPAAPSRPVQRRPEVVPSGAKLAQGTDSATTPPAMSARRLNVAAGYGAPVPGRPVPVAPNVAQPQPPAVPAQPPEMSEQPPAMSAQPPAMSAQPPAMSAQPPAASPPPVAPSVPTPPITVLPPDAPKLTITGGVYSENASRRLLIVNGQVYGEGAEPVPGVTIEQIRANRAVLRFRGQRYAVNF